MSANSRGDDPTADPNKGPTFPVANPAAPGETVQMQDERDPALGAHDDRFRRAFVTEQPISVAEMARAVEDDRCGAIVTFDGVVRNHDEGRGVLALDYTAHPTADAIMREVVQDLVQRFPDVIIAAAHRVGPLAIGDSALACAVAAPHRKRAFEACDLLVDEVKSRVPIWKHQRFEDGTEEWVAALA